MSFTAQKFPTKQSKVSSDFTRAFRPRVVSAEKNRAPLDKRPMCVVVKDTHGKVYGRDARGVIRRMPDDIPKVAKEATPK